jgi:hypothetical protein
MTYNEGRTKRIPRRVGCIRIVTVLGIVCAILACTAFVMAIGH